MRADNYCLMTTLQIDSVKKPKKTKKQKNKPTRILPSIYFDATKQRIKCTMDCEMLADFPPLKCQTKKPSVNKQRCHLSGVFSNLLIHKLIPPLSSPDC